MSFAALRRALLERLARGESRAFARAELRGLPMDEASRMARARAMGFDVDTPMYHGTASRDIEEFLPRGGGEDSERTLNWYRSRVAANEPIGGMNFRSGSFFSPDAEFANNYTAENTGVVYPVFLRTRNPLSFESSSRKWSLQNQGQSADALVITDSGKVNEVAVIEPSNVRSRFAAFDPSRSNRRDILAGLAIAAPVGGLTLRELLQDRMGQT